MPGPKTLPSLLVTWIALTLLVACAPRTAIPPAPASSTFQAETVDQDAESPDDVALPDRAVRFRGEIVLPWVDPAEQTGTLHLLTTDSPLALANALAERFQDEGFAGSITVEPGSEANLIKRFCILYQADALLLPRPLTSAEEAQCTGEERTLVAWQVSWDAVAAVVSAEANRFASDLTLNELRQAFSTATTWQDLRPDWPAQPILRFSPHPEGSDTFAFLVQRLFNGDAGPLLNAANLTLTEGFDALREGVAASPYAIGYLDFRIAQEYEDQIMPLAINHIPPFQNTPDYPLRRPIMLYTYSQTLQNRPQVAAFLNFFLTYANEESANAGYFPLTTEELNQAKAAWLQAIGLPVP